MAWSASKVFARMLSDSLTQTALLDLNSDSFKVALYNNTPTPDNAVTAANSAYNVDQWVTANEQYQAGQWAQTGVALTSPAINVSTTTVQWDASDTASGAACTLANVYGALVYDDTLTTPVADQGVCYNYFGGVQSVTAGTFTVVWNTAGIASFSVA
jgi:hypothetical protein